jgi:very-short-patch-repair endonuclease
MAANTTPRRTARPSEPSFCKNEGYRVLRLWNNEILENLDGVHHTIADALAASPPPSPPPSRGRAI